MLGSLFRKKKSFAGLVSTVDMHSHLLPGIDDGVATLEESLEVIRGFKNLGYTKIITTPHVMHDFYKNTPEIIGEKLLEVREALKASELNIELEAAAEYYLDEHFLELIEGTQPLLTFGDNYVLFELSFVSKPMILKEAIFKLQTKGYKPVLAHPERYLYFHRSPTELEDIFQNGALLQLNLLSLSGYYSKPVQQMAKKLLKQNQISLIGSDCHNARQLSALVDTLSSSDVNALSELKLLNNTL